MNDAVELHKCERRFEEALALLNELFKAANGSPHLALQHRELQRRVKAFLQDHEKSGLR